MVRVFDPVAGIVVAAVGVYTRKPGEFPDSRTTVAVMVKSRAEFDNVAACAVGEVVIEIVVDDERRRIGSAVA
jgi:homoserine kinase